MITNKQRAALRGIASKTETILSVGKNGVTPDVTAAVAEALASRELVKVAVLNNCEMSAADAAEMLSGRTRSDIVQVIGKKLVLYRRNPDRKEGILDERIKG